MDAEREQQVNDVMNPQNTRRPQSWLDRFKKMKSKPSHAEAPPPKRRPESVTELREQSVNDVENSHLDDMQSSLDIFASRLQLLYILVPNPHLHTAELKKS